jgi:hypothetical protein
MSFTQQQVAAMPRIEVECRVAIRTADIEIGDLFYDSPWDYFEVDQSPGNSFWSRWMDKLLHGDFGNWTIAPRYCSILQDAQDAANNLGVSYETTDSPDTIARKCLLAE